MRGWLAAPLGLLAIGCNGTSPMAPSVDVYDGAAATSLAADHRVRPQHVYVTWTTDGPFLSRVPDELALDVLARLEAAAGGALVIHRQRVGTPQIRIRVDDATLDHDGARGLAWWTGPCAGDVAIESSAVADPLILLHELGHLLISGQHSPHAEDVLAPGGTFRPYVPTTFSARETGILRANLASGCTRIDSWAGL